MTARDMIKGSLRLLGVLASGEEPTAAEAQDALTSLNSMIDSWRTDRLMVYVVLPVQFQTVANQAAYTLGPAGNWNMVRPERVDSAQLLYSQSGAPSPMTLPLDLIDMDQYNAIVLPSTATSIPQRMYLDSNFPLRTARLWPVPDSVQTVQLNYWAVLASIADLDTVISFPPGYEKALRFGLAVELAPEFGTEASDTVQRTASVAKADVKSANNTYTPLMRSDAALTGGRAGFDYRTGE